MNKTYAICVTSCDILDLVNRTKPLKKCDLVQVVYTNEEAEKCSLKLLIDDTAAIKFTKQIYFSDLKNFRIVPYTLLQFLISADYSGRLNILQNEKDILDLRIDSKVTLRFIDSIKREYSIEFVISYIGAFAKIGIGNFIGLNFANFGSLRDFGAILMKISEIFHHKCDEIESVIVIRVEQLFCKILLSGSVGKNSSIAQTQAKPVRGTPMEAMIFKEIPDIPNKEALVQGLYRKYNNRNDQNSSFISVGVGVLFSEIELDGKTSPMQPVSLSKDHSIVDNSGKDYFIKNTPDNPYSKPNQIMKQFENVQAMEVDVPQDNSSQLMKTTEERAKNNSEIMKRIEIDKLGKKNPKMCMICMKIFDTKGDLFIFSCNHKFCVKCVLDRLDDIKRDNTSCCPICGETLKGKSKLEALNNFVQNSFSGEETCSPQSHKKGLNYNIRQKNDNKKLNYLSGNRKAFDSNEKVHSGSSGNKIEIRYCKNCNTINKYSDTFCKDCRRPLTANDYSFISVGKES